MEDDFNEKELFSSDAIEMSTVKPAAVNENPLSKYFRLPGLTVPLPSGGRYYSENVLDANGHLEIFPMRAADEMLLKSPDALMNGLAVENLIKSCAPSIRNPKEVVSPDVDVILLAIRSATYGNMMEMEDKCPTCDHPNTFEFDLTDILNTMKPLPEDLSIRLSDEVTVDFVPHTLDTQTKLLLMAYEENRRAKQIEEEDDSEAKGEALREILTRMQNYQHENISNAIVSVTTPDGMVTDKSFIKDFVINAPSEWHNKIKDRVIEINEMGIDRTVHAKCQKCEHEWTTQLEFNPSSFFDHSS